jgi:hypothetical protein
MNFSWGRAQVPWGKGHLAWKKPKFPKEMHVLNLFAINYFMFIVIYAFHLSLERGQGGL